jgi:hypothetical protein
VTASVRCASAHILDTVILAGMFGAAAASAQQSWSWGVGVPSLNGIPDGFRGMPKHGEFMAAGVACGLRPATWEARYRAAVERWVRSRAENPADAATVMQFVDRFADYARRARGDTIVPGRERPY